MMAKGRRVLTALDRFFFQSHHPRAAAAFRILFGGTLLLNAGFRMLHTDVYFSEASGIPAVESTQVLPEFFRPAIDLFPATAAAAWGVQILLVASLICIILGVFGRVGSRVVAAAAFVCHLSLMQRNYSIVYGADIVSSFWLFGLCFIDTSEVWSVRQFRTVRLKMVSALKANLSLEPEWSRVLSSVGLRLIQIQLCLIYGYTGFEKLKGHEWWDQTAVWNVLGNEQLMMADLSFLKSVPLVIALATWGTVLFEVYAPVLLWLKSTKRWTMVLGVGLHFGIAASMGLVFFSLTMLSAYVLFLDESDWTQALRFSRRFSALR